MLALRPPNSAKLSVKRDYRHYPRFLIPELRARTFGALLIDFRFSCEFSEPCSPTRYWCAISLSFATRARAAPSFDRLVMITDGRAETEATRFRLVLEHLISQTCCRNRLQERWSTGPIRVSQEGPPSSVVLSPVFDCVISRLRVRLGF